MAADSKSFNWRWFMKATALVLAFFLIVVPAFFAVALIPVVDQPLYNFILFHPSKYPIGSYDHPIAAGVKAKEVYLLSSSGTKIHGWLFIKPGAKYIVVLSHGNGGNLTWRADIHEMMLKAGHSVFAYDYQGYGLSDGSPNMYNICEDSQAAYNYVAKTLHYKPEQIILFGESLGTAVTGQLAMKNKCAAVILQNPLYSIMRRGREILPVLSAYPQFMWPQGGFDTGTFVQGKHPPLLIVGGTKDTMLPIAHADSLYALASEPKTYIRVEGGGHTGDKILMGEQYRSGYEKFCNSLP